MRIWKDSAAVRFNHFVDRGIHGAVRILITGLTGFAGQYLADLISAEQGVEIHGISRGQIAPSQLSSRYHIHSCDLGSAPAVDRLMRSVAPKQIYHLAGYANAGQSNREPEAAWQNNLTVTRILYEAIDRWGGKPRVVYVGSGLIYGPSQDAVLGQHENVPLCPTNPYATSKAAADLISYQMSVNPGLEIIRARPYNHIGPRQQESFAIPNFARQIVAIERGLQPPVLQTGNLGAERDLTDVRDVVRAYVGLMKSGRPNEAYNIASGKSRSMSSVLEALLSRARVKVTIQQNADLLRPIDQSVPRVAISKIRKEIGWEPQIPLEQSLGDILDFWRSQ